MDLSVTKTWEPTHTKDWDGVWCRAFLDAVVVQDVECSIIDYKTGKIYEKDHEEQGKLYAPCAFAHFPEVEVVDVEMWYLDQEDVLTWQYTRDQFESLKKYWKKLSTPLFREKKYTPTTGDHCRWCPFVENCKREKGGVK